MQADRAGLLSIFALVAIAAPVQSATVGLSAVGAQRLDGDLSPGLPPQAGDHFAFALAAGDFDGDGDLDLAVGMPHDDGAAGAEVADSGTVVIRMSVTGAGPTGPVATLRQLGGGLEAGDVHGFALASCDFDGDGFDDLAVGAPGEDLGGIVDAGAVFVYRGGSGGLDAGFFGLFTQDTEGIPEAAESDDLFGRTLACADFDADGFDDLVVGAPGERVGAHLEAGAVFGVLGSATGLDPDASFAFLDGQIVDDGAKLGFSLATGDWNGDGYSDLAAGEPGEAQGRGAVHVKFGSAAGVNLANGLHLDESEIGGLTEAGDLFAHALAAGDFDGDLHDDLAIGIPGEDLNVGGTIPNCGQANVLYGGAAGFDLGRTQFLTQHALGGGGASEAFDQFGETLSAGDFDRDSRDDLAVGAPGESVTGPRDGTLTVVAGAPGGLALLAVREFAAGHDGLPGDPDQHERLFTFAFVAADFDADGYHDLAVGAPFEDDALADVGALTILYGSLFSDGFESGPDELLWSGVVP